jgi:murein DD-endopeptidase MepM/ murein hydrolase activator NlpD
LGVDIVSPFDRDLISMSYGKVIAVGLENKIFGNNVFIEHYNYPNNSGITIRARYCHLESLEVKKGMIVQKGQTIGMLGKTGEATGYHLHLEIYYKTPNGNWIVQNPMKTNTYGGGITQ